MRARCLQHSSAVLGLSVLRPQCVVGQHLIQQIRQQSSQSRAVNATQDAVASKLPSLRGLPIITNTSYAFQGTVPSLDTTRPPPLEVPEAPSIQSYPNAQSRDPTKWNYGYLFKIGKAYGSFYKTGVKQTWRNFKAARTIRARIGTSKADEIARYEPSSQNISYNEYELLLRNRKDLRKVPFFAVLLIIFGEWLPLIILFIGSRAVPGSCVIPKQTLHDLKKWNLRQNFYLTAASHLPQPSPDSSTRSITSLPTPIQTRWNLLTAYSMNLTHLTTFSTPLGPSFYSLIIEPRLRRQCNEILSSLVLAQREGGWSTRSPSDVFDIASKLGSHSLRRYVSLELARSEKTASTSTPPPILMTDEDKEKMKKEILPYLESTTQEVLSYDFANTPKEEHWRAVLQSVYPWAKNADAKERSSAIQEAKTKA